MFKTWKSPSEYSSAHPISFNSEDTYLSYNLPITPLELRSTIHKNLRNASPGPDNIHASMLKYLHSNSFDYLLSLFNALACSKNHILLLETDYHSTYPETL